MCLRHVTAHENLLFLEEVWLDARVLVAMNTQVPDSHLLGKYLFGC